MQVREPHKVSVPPDEDCCNDEAAGSHHACCCDGADEKPILRLVWRALQAISHHLSAIFALTYAILQSGEALI